MAYTPPAGDAVNFTFTGSYSAPEGDAVHFLFGVVACVTINHVSRTNVTNQTGFDTSTIKWTSSAAGPYRVEIGGSGQSTGGLVDSGYCATDSAVFTDVEDDDITTWSGYTGAGSYRFNVYVQSVDDIWTPYNYSC